jgi:ABC-type spermidine/putrescine transport system permease subunit I
VAPDRSAPFRKPAYPLLLPAWIALAVFFLAPLFLMLAVSFAERGTYGGIEPVGNLWAYLRSGAFLANYARSFGALYLWIGWRSLWMAALTTALAIVVSFPIAYYLAILAPARWKGTSVYRVEAASKGVVRRGSSAAMGMEDAPICEAGEGLQDSACRTAGPDSP